jgi:hypothetical protein
MSFYTGRHRLSSGVMKKQLHITANPQTLAYMQGGVQSDTVFHSDCKYLDYKIYDLTSVRDTTLYNSGVSIYNGFGYPDRPVSVFYLSDEILKYIHTNNHAFGVYDYNSYQTDHSGDLTIKVSSGHFPDF